MLKNKIGITTIALLFVLFCGCKKDEATPEVKPPDNTWTLDGKTYVVGSVTRSDFFGNKAIVFANSEPGSKESLAILFKSFPTTSGTYVVVGLDGTPLKDGQCTIEGMGDNGQGFIFSGYNPPTSLSIKVNAGNKIELTIPEVTVIFPSPSIPVKLKASVYEP